MKTEHIVKQTLMQMKIDRGLSYMRKRKLDKFRAPFIQVKKTEEVNGLDFKIL
jgi:hypothetical protein